MTRTRYGHGLPAVAWLTCLALTAGASAQWHIDINAGLYGDLDQFDIPGNNLYSHCGPAVAVNSFVYLQNAYGGVYDSFLVPPQGADHDNDGDVDFYDHMIDAALILGSPAYMNSKPMPFGTSHEDFIWGKEKYMETKVPGVTEYHAQDFWQWTIHTPPDWVEPIAPMWEFLYYELVDGKDIELLITWMPDWEEGSGHYVTLTGFHWNDGNNDGVIDIWESAYINFIDSVGGVPGSAQIWHGTNFELMTNYIQGAWIGMAVSEGPGQEPEQWDVQKDAGLFGNLDQGKIPGNAAFSHCGPAAAVNSFVYLQNAYGGIYDNRLVPPQSTDHDSDGDVDFYDHMIDVGLILGSGSFMNSKPVPLGTSHEDFIWGKRKYLEAKVPGVTKYHAQDFWSWTSHTPPGWVEPIAPMWEFLYYELVDCNDVEVLITWPDDWEEGSGHYVTLTGFHWTDGNNDGIIDIWELASIDFIDSLGGVPGSANIWHGPNSELMTNYQGIQGAWIGMAVSEGPGPAVALRWSENFDSYNTIANLPSQSTWEAWGGAPGAVNFFATTAQCVSSPNSVEIDNGDDAVHRYFRFTRGKWEYSTWVYVPSNMNGKQYFILLNNYPASVSPDWSLQIELDGAAGAVNDFNSDASLPLVTDAWIRIRVIIDLDHDVQSAYYNDQHLVTKSWSGGVAAGGLVNIGAVDLFANSVAVAVYYDDMYLGPPTVGAPSFSIDFHGTTIGAPDSLFGIPITEGDILLPPPPFLFPVLGYFGTPGTAVWGGPGPNPGPDLGLMMWEQAVGHCHDVPGYVEVDAISYGTDFDLDFDVPWMPLWSFSVDEYAQGLNVGSGPNVYTEAIAPSWEASADVFVDDTIGHGPFDLSGAPRPDHAIFDGNGLFPWGGPGYGLAEPNPPAPGSQDLGDTVDALDVDEAVGPQYGLFPVYFSLDSPYVDPLEGPPVNSGSAAVHGFVGGDVLVTTSPGAPPAVYAAATQLGLDLVGGPDSDDLDALILWENGDGVYQPSQEPFDWHGGATDMLLFSVRRGSTLVTSWDVVDSRLGIPIVEGDILCPPVAGGQSPYPGIFIPAEMLGLRTWRDFPVLAQDDLDALDVSADCNGNGLPDPDDIFNGLAVDCNSNFVPDECDIQIETSLDCNYNGIPDECESPPPCPEDVDGNCIVNTADLLILLGNWGCAGSMCPGDVDFDGDVDTSDLLALLAAWGPC